VAGAPAMYRIPRQLSLSSMPRSAFPHPIY
jgi:hypothetical protein